MLVRVSLHPSLWVVKSGEQPGQVDLALSEGTTAATLLTSLTRQRNVVVVINGGIRSRDPPDGWRQHSAIGPHQRRLTAKAEDYSYALRLSWKGIAR